MDYFRDLLGRFLADPANRAAFIRQLEDLSSVATDMTGAKVKYAHPGVQCLNRNTEEPPAGGLTIIEGEDHGDRTGKI